MATWITLQPLNPSYLNLMPSQSPSPVSLRLRRRRYIFRCAPLQQQERQVEDEGVIMCEDCNGKGWLLCDFCKGQKTNVKSETKKIYRRCPSCRAVGYVLCRKCKVFRCVTFPTPDDGDELLF